MKKELKFSSVEIVWLKEKYKLKYGANISGIEALQYELGSDFNVISLERENENYIFIAKIEKINKMKKLLIKWLCKPCKKQPECLESLVRVYIGIRPIIGDSLFYLTADEFGNQSYTLLPSGRYKLNGKVLVIENELVKSYE